MTTWVAPAITGVAGVLTGATAGWFGRPMAAVRADNHKERRSHRRELIADVRQLVQDVRAEGNGAFYPHRVAQDPRFQAVSARLRSRVRKQYTEAPDRVIVVLGDHGPCTDLIDETRRLEKRWRLV